MLRVFLDVYIVDIGPRGPRLHPNLSPPEHLDVSARDHPVSDPTLRERRVALFSGSQRLPRVYGAGSAPGGCSSANFRHLTPVKEPATSSA